VGMTTSESRSAATTEDGPFRGLGWVLPVYDLMTAAMRIAAADEELLAHANLQPAHRVLDVGCGTGRLTLQAGQDHPQATIVGLDPDPAALERARRKARARGVAVRFDLGYAGSLAYADESIDRVLSAFVIHHLIGEERSRALTEMRRVLAPNGSVHLIDFGSGDDLAIDLQHAGFTTGALTRLTSCLTPRMTIIDARR
jgi:ubiquinone/menaquinone biosynthesis C-methylase UbiE